ncbi:hypothetical protein IG631_07133 [Alternaria alternata]|nr:hypothetical protein IG631_07133 [Alternaria alternata]
MSHSPYTSLRDRLSDHIVLAHAMHTVRLPVCNTHDEAWWCSHRRRVHTCPDLCKSMQDKVYATCQGDTMRHPRGFAGAELRMSHLFHGLAVAWADGRSTAASRWHQVYWRGREHIGPGTSAKQDDVGHFSPAQLAPNKQSCSVRRLTSRRHRPNQPRCEWGVDLYSRAACAICLL